MILVSNVMVVSIHVNANIAYKKRTDLKLDKTYFESIYSNVPNVYDSGTRGILHSINRS